MIPKYLKFLSTGCHGLGQAVYPCQLVIFSLLPNDLMLEGFLKFSKDFLAACWKGFFCNSIHKDSLEFTEMILEVGWYCIIKCQTQVDFVQITLVDPLLATFQKEVPLLKLILECAMGRYISKKVDKICSKNESICTALW